MQMRYKFDYRVPGFFIAPAPVVYLSVSTIYTPAPRSTARLDDFLSRNYIKTKRSCAVNKASKRRGIGRGTNPSRAHSPGRLVWPAGHADVRVKSMNYGIWNLHCKLVNIVQSQAVRHYTEAACFVNWTYIIFFSLWSLWSSFQISYPQIYCI